MDTTYILCWRWNGRLRKDSIVVIARFLVVTCSWCRAGGVCHICRKKKTCSKYYLFKMKANEKEHNSNVKIIIQRFCVCVYNLESPCVCVCVIHQENNLYFSYFTSPILFLLFLVVLTLFSFFLSFYFLVCLSSYFLK